MSQEELVAAYVGGRMNRRTLIRRLVAGGASFGAAVAYAHLLQPGVAPARLHRGVHFDGDVEIVSRDLDRVIEDRGLKVRVQADRSMSISLELWLLRNPEKTLYPNAIVGRKVVNFDGVDTKKVRIPFNANRPHSFHAVRNQNRQARFRVLAEGNVGFGTTIYSDEEVVRR